ncbi:transaldolase [Cryptosporangium phraense]|uniref:Transaldolase n=1 Tax=Cryptosporangium phraense TaxID=2593070 RepID=A0A545AER4_9ACTN|nr:transaldolase [Cryptosporangium phraense]TQS39803.1 transaldolase [Cryptosporangium phraense]
MTSSLQVLAAYGQSPWVDYLSRVFARGELSHLVREGVAGVTSNPTIFQSAIAEGGAYDEQMREVLRSEDDPKQVFLALAIQDVRAACDLLRPVYDRADSSRDGWVSFEVDPHLAHDADATVAEAVALFRRIDRPNLFIKIPGTTDELVAVEETIARGVPVNVTLLFSLERHRAAAHAYLRGLHRFREAGGDLRAVASVASFFVSRVDTEADRRLDERGGPNDLKGTLGIANAKLAYEAYREIFAGDDWTDLQAVGASPQRCLWASTGMKDPDRRDVTYVEELIGPDTVTTMPRATLEAFLDHGRVADTLTGGVEDAHRTLTRFAEAGVDYDKVIAVLEREGVDAFVTSFEQLFAGIAGKRAALIGA